MYKVFFNESQLVFMSESEEDNNLMFDTSYRISHFDEIVVILENIEKLALKKIIQIVYEDFASIQSGFNVIRSAGGLIKNADSKYLFIKRMNRWDLPKGRIEEGESSEQAAVREVEEECGLHGHTIVRYLEVGYHIFRSPYYPPPYNWVWKEAVWYEMYYAGSETPVPQIEEDITKVEWFAKEDILLPYKSTYLNIKKLLDSYLL